MASITHRLKPFSSLSSSSNEHKKKQAFYPNLVTFPRLSSDPNKTLSLVLKTPKSYIHRSTPKNNPSSTQLFSLASSLWKSFEDKELKKIQSVPLWKSFEDSAVPKELKRIQNVQQNLVCMVGPLFFTSLRDRPSGYLNTPLTVVAGGMAKWLDIYRQVLMIRVMLSWFPNIPWDRQPLSAIRDLCDPYLNLFRNIIPPVFGHLDVSPLLGFAVLGTLGSILRNNMGMF